MGGRSPGCVSCLEAAGCDKTWEGCTGFTPPSLSMPLVWKADAASCTDDDKKIWGSKGGGGGLDHFEDDMTACGKQCLGKSDCVKTCIEGKEHYSDACAACF